MNTDLRIFLIRSISAIFLTFVRTFEQKSEKNTDHILGHLPIIAFENLKNWQI